MPKLTNESLVSMIESLEDLPSKILLFTTTVQQSNTELKDILTKVLQKLQNSRIESNSKITELKNLGTTGLAGLIGLGRQVSKKYHQQSLKT